MSPGPEPDRTPGLLTRLRGAGLLPRKALGQHFLHDPALLRSIVGAAELPRDAHVLEIGTGPATLTREIARVAGSVLTVEVDARMAAFARAELRGVDNVEVLVCDALDGHGGLQPELLAKLKDVGGFYWISNLPYAVGTPLILAILFCDLQWRRAVLTVQREVAERLTASAVARGDGKARCGARSAYGPLSLLVACRARAEIVRRLPAGAFSPPPRVESGVVRLEPLAAPPVTSAEELDALRGWVQALFQGRRKQIGGLLRERLGAAGAAAALERGGWSRAVRPENLRLDDFLLLAREFPP